MGTEKSLSNISWEQFSLLRPEAKAEYFKEAPYHALVAQQFTRERLDKLCELTTKVRRIAKRQEGKAFLKTLLCDKRAMLYFAQPSTRTYLSFLSACQVLGMDTMDVRDTSTSSELKGESPEDSVRTFSSYADMIIMRHPAGGFAERIAWMLSNTRRSVPVMNAGSGKDQHPTQALLDIYTLNRSFEKNGGIDGKKIVFCGDLKRGRTVRSLAALLTQYKNVKIYFVAPDALQVKRDLLLLLDMSGLDYELCTDFERVIPDADAIYMTRIQDEWDVDGESRAIDTVRYHFRKEHLSMMKEGAIIMHPLPRREEIEVAVDSDPRAMYWRQARNGMWARAALMLSVFERGDLVHDYYRSNKPEDAAE